MIDLGLLCDTIEDNDILICTLEEKLRIATDALTVAMARTESMRTITPLYMDMYKALEEIQRIDESSS